MHGNILMFLKYDSFALKLLHCLLESHLQNLLLLCSFLHLFSQVIICCVFFAQLGSDFTRTVGEVLGQQLLCVF